MSYLDYGALFDKAIVDIIKNVLTITEKSGLMGGNYFYISFYTTFPNVVLPASLLDKYPVDMTIVLQNQFEDLRVYDSYFEVVLYFHGKPHKLRVPFNSIHTFADPSVEFILQLHNDDNTKANKHNTADNEKNTKEDTDRFLYLDEFNQKIQ
ncbi:Stringent starvation protein B superfamily protein [Candidatus Cyrtobacter comes]|uniref:Stringent starvation protein B superfamily protein n=1 Tax=Candidatus Cyrtobacter comes TaxID=675776 RepID=A0ABU5L781_9RICK|nr:ClpXP protease specificity-enhancing factor SspB [Candidatus Cyrtobacter comes]MDZ5761987.1 Stringent starvation protein B superfamily protein [Candidatus Cyrtobacter comes]